MRKGAEEGAQDEYGREEEGGKRAWERLERGNKGGVYKDLEGSPDGRGGEGLGLGVDLRLTRIVLLGELILERRQVVCDRGANK